MRFKTIKEATEYFLISEFSEIPGSIIDILFEYDLIQELTEMYDEFEEYRPMWSAMWCPKSEFNENWIRNNISKMRGLGFRVYETNCGELLIGINGCGYSFIEEHFIPLYKAQGLKWHDSVRKKK